MRPFNFQSATTTEAAVNAKARFLAGGTTLIDLMKLDVEAPESVVDITRLPLAEIKESKGSVWIGATALNSEVAHHSIIQKRLPVLSEALLSGASPQLRNLATTGGNLLQRTRCSYFRDTTWACNKRIPGSGCSALEGINRMHAILGTSNDCIATSPSDMNVALMALDAKIHTTSRVIPIRSFYALPGKTPHIETALEPNELITHVEIPVQDWYRHSHYAKVRDRASYAFALTSAAVALKMKGDRIEEARVALGGVGTIPWRSEDAEQALKGQSADENTFRKAAEAALANTTPRRMNAFKVQLAKETLIRSLIETRGLV